MHNKMKKSTKNNANKGPEPKKVNNGRCSICQKSQFTLCIINHQLHRICKECGKMFNMVTMEETN